MSSERLTLLCFAYAGGSAEYYSRWSKFLTNVSIIPVEIPGRGIAKDLPLLVTREDLIEYLLGEFAHWCVPPFALFGHSLGARIAFEFLTVLEQAQGLKATHLFVSGCLAPERFAQAMRIREQNFSDLTLLEVLRNLGGTPPEIMADCSLIKAALPIIRADFKLAIDLSKNSVLPVTAPINLLLGSKDKVTSLFEDYSGWTSSTSQGCQISVIDGDHFFIRSQMREVIRLVGDKLKETTLNED